MSRRIPRAAIGAVLLAAIVGASLAVGLTRSRAQVERLIATVGALPVDYWLAFSAGQILVAMCGVLPASIMAIAAGAAYGMVNGLLLSAGCTMLGGWLSFLLARSMLRPWIARWIGRHKGAARFDEAIAREGWRFVCLLRISPVMPFAATSYALGLTDLRQRDYLLGTLASLPALAIYVSVGAFGSRSLALLHMGAGPWRWIPPALGVAALILAALRLQRVIATAAAPLRG